MNHLHRDLAPISETGWAAIDDEAKGRLTTYSRRAQARRFRRAARLGAFGDRAGPDHDDRGTIGGRHRGPAPGAAPRRGTGGVQRLARRARRRRSGRHRPRPARVGRGRAADRHRGERGRVPRLWRRRDRGHHREHLACADQARAGHVEISDGSGAGGGRPSSVGHRRSLRDGHLPEASTRRSSNPPSTAAICSSITCTRFWAARWSGRPASTERSC